jgi:hypothetical protein
MILIIGFICAAILLVFALIIGAFVSITALSFVLTLIAYLIERITPARAKTKQDERN